MITLNVEVESLSSRFRSARYWMERCHVLQRRHGVPQGAFKAEPPRVGQTNDYYASCMTQQELIRENTTTTTTTTTPSADPELLRLGLSRAWHAEAVSTAV